MRSKGTALIDGDVLVHRFSRVGETKTCWGNSASVSLDLEYATIKMNQFINSIMLNTRCSDYLVFLSGTKNFRKKVMPSYKHNRKDLVKPVLYKDIRQYLLKNHDAWYLDMLEADDLLGIQGTNPTITDPVICTIDKDLKQIPCRNYNWNTMEFCHPTREEGQRLFMKQILMGDTVDGYPGVPLIGPKKADFYLDEAEKHGIDTWEMIMNLHLSKDLDETYALKTANVARILQYDDYNLVTGEITPWTS